jgi:type VI secretion system protein
VSRSLLARVRDPHVGLARSGPAADGALRDSILENVLAMCRTRRGTVPMRPDYGLPDISEMVHSFPDAITELELALRHTIKKYEPRIRSVHVKHVPTEAVELVLRFEVTATLAVSASSVHFETRLSPSLPPEVR